MDKYKALVIGGGFYGARIALHLSQHLGFSKVAIIEQAPHLFQHASYGNQARVHSGFHYPRSLITAYRSQINYPRFMAEYKDAVLDDCLSLYAVSKKNSKVNAGQFRRFCATIKAPLAKPSKAQRDLFNADKIDDVFLVEEKVFDARKLANILEQNLTQAGVAIKYNLKATKVLDGRVVCATSEGAELSLAADYVFNCTYSGLCQIEGIAFSAPSFLQHQLTELALVKAPEAFRNLGITLIDGAFFSLLPFPAQPECHTLSHVRYTRHQSWRDDERNPYAALDSYAQQSHYKPMQLAAAQYVPALRELIYRNSIFEVKTLLTQHEKDDGRPIYFEKNADRVYSILGGKMDNIYDVLEKLEAEGL